MQGTIQADLRQFREFLIQQVDGNPVGLTPEDVLDQWRAGHPLPGEQEASAAEIQQTLDEMRSEALSSNWNEMPTDARWRWRIPW